MGTTCHTWLVGPGADEATSRAQATIARLEGLWSRFLPTSDISRLNAAAGQPVAVAAETSALIGDAIRWWGATDGRFDPTVLPALQAAGYNRDRRAGHGPIRAGAPAPGCAGIQIDPGAGTVQLPDAVHLDLGGIGKGRTADLVAEELRQLQGGLVDLGGDLRAWGTAPGEGTGWPIAIEDLRDESTIAVLGLTCAAVATSSTLRRRWHDGTRWAHHLIDPREGRPTEGELVTVTVVAALAAPAEVLAKAAIVAGTVAAAERLLAEHDVAALLVSRGGAPRAVGGFESLCWTPPLEVV
jgi:thiamine biosynthesis lipoprotein